MRTLGLLPSPELGPSLLPAHAPSSVPACRPASRQAAALGTAPRTPRSCSGWDSRLGGFGWSPSSPSTAAGAHTGAGRTAARQGAKGVSAGGSRWEASPALYFPGPRQRPREAKVTQQMRSKGGTRRGSAVQTHRAARNEALTCGELSALRAQRTNSLIPLGTSRGGFVEELCSNPDRREGAGGASSCKGEQA